MRLRVWLLAYYRRELEIMERRVAEWAAERERRERRERQDREKKRIDIVSRRGHEREVGRVANINTVEMRWRHPGFK
jgi:hypothetical protein